MYQKKENKKGAILFSIVCFFVLIFFCLTNSIFKNETTTVNAAACSATGGTVTQSNGYCLHTFTSSGTFTPSANLNVEYLIVGGGGGGWGPWYGAGGGAGGVLAGTGYAVTPTAYTVTVGAGGLGGNGTSGAGGNSVFGSLTAIGGGGGASCSGYNGCVGGSGGGGGGGSAQGYGGAGTSGQGYSGGNGINGCGYGNDAGGGGGGAGGAGTSATGCNYGGAGGPGIANSITGTSVYYAGGGSGGGSSGGGGGGVGGGGNANAGSATYYGGGGAGTTGGSSSGGNGYQGIVIIKYLSSGIYQVTGVPTFTSSTTPSYTFNSTSAGTITYSGDCSSSTTTAVAGNNTITFNTLSVGYHSNCTITVGGNTLSVSPFTIVSCPASGGTLSVVNGYCLHTFTSSGTFTSSANLNVEYLVVAGGGGGAGPWYGSGGGAGGVLSGSGYAITPSAYTVTVGTGGGQGAAGGNSVFGSLIAIGGGASGGGAGGSGGGGTGGGSIYNPGGAGTSGQGYAGGHGVNGCGYGNDAGGGGGGAGGAGGDVTGCNYGGAGGVGIANSITGTSTYYAGGGSGTGSSGGGGAGNGGGGAPLGGSATYYGGGGGGNTGGSGSGGSGYQGIVIVKYLPVSIYQVAAVPTFTNSTTPSYTFNSVASGTITYGGDCSSSTTTAAVGSNTIIFNALSSGYHSNCTITVGGNTLSVSPFTIVSCPASGGTLSMVNGYCLHTFTSSGSFVSTTNLNVEVLVVAGGGGGGGGNNAGGGGGAGGLIYYGSGSPRVAPSFAVTSGNTYTVTVGGGGSGGTINADTATNGGNSVFGSLTAIGGGRGAYPSASNTAGYLGGSGGGGAAYTSGAPAGGAGTSGQGNSGGSGYGLANYTGGGGGGAGGVGGNATSSQGGAGGVGLPYSITGAFKYYAGGGGGGTYVLPSTPGAGGLGGGGNGANNSTSSTIGVANTGGGGGGAGYPATTASNGGSGVVIVRYPLPTSFSYRKPITVNNTSNNSILTGYQVAVTVDTAALVTAGKLQSDCDDLRFTDNSSSFNSAAWTNNYPYWIESGCNTTATKIWIRVDSIAASANKTIYMYYGNSSALTLSSGDDTFNFFDDFTGTSIDSSKWRSTGGTTNSVSGGVATLQCTSASGVIQRLVSQSSFGVGYTAGFKYKIATTNAWVGWTNKTDNSGTYAGDTGVTVYNGNARNLINYHNASFSSMETSAVDTTNYIVRNIGRSSSGDFFATRNYTETISVAPSDLANYYVFITPYDVGYTYVDWALIRLYTSVEPTTLVGAEEAAVFLSEVTAVPSPTASTTPSYTFSSTSAGTITYGGDCSSSTTTAVTGNNTIYFNALSVAQHSNCTIRVGASNVLQVNTFTVTATCPAAGGTTTLAGGYCVHKFLSSGSFVPTTNLNVEYLIVGGGGGGGRYGGGGGAGGLRAGSFVINSGNYPIVVGSGGAGWAGDAQSGGNAGSGTNSSFNSIVAAGGGGGGNYGNATGGSVGLAGGSGGGSGNMNSVVGTSNQSAAGNTPSTNPSQGNAGGSAGTGHYSAISAGGGGGAGAAGATGAAGGGGGIGVISSISGIATYYAGGGSGGQVSAKLAGGLGGGGYGQVAGTTTADVDAVANTGGGGGGARDGLLASVWRAGNGGSGIVIVRYPAPTVFTNRKTVKISNFSNTNTLTNYPVLLTVDTAALITAGKLKSTACNDLRFTDNSSSFNSAAWTNNYPYWIESGCNTTATKIWIKVDSIAASASKGIYMYYGNSSALAFSDGNNVFNFFDDFTGTTINTSKWSKTDASGYITQNGALTISNGPGSWGALEMHTVNNFSRSDGLVVQGKYTSTMAVGVSYKDTTMLWVKDSGTGTSYTDYIYALYPYSNGSPVFYMYEDGTSRAAVAATMTASTPYTIRQIVKTSGGALTQTSINGGSTWTNIYDSSYSSESPFKVGFVHYQGGVVTIDDVIVRKYSSPEPTAAIIVSPTWREKSPF